PGPPPGPPAAAASAPPASRRRVLIGVIPVALAVVIALVAALLINGGSKKTTLATKPAADLTPGAWGAVQSAPTPRQELASAVDDGVIWVLGGLDGPDSTPNVEGYDPASNTWKAGPPLPLPLHHEMAATYKGDIVVAGGWVPEGGVLNAKTSDQVFTLRAGKWVELPRLKHPRSAGAAAVAGDKLVVFGGQAEGKLVAQTEVWDGKRWTDGPDLPTPRDHLAAASDGTYVYAVGGRLLAADKNVAAFERFDPGAGAWVKLPDMPAARGDLGAAVVGGRLVAAGGESATGVFPNVDSYDIAKKVWSPLPPMRTPRHGIAMAAVGTSVYAFDGAVIPSHGQSTAVAEVLPFTPATSASAAPTSSPSGAASPWRAVHDAPTARQEVASTVADGVIWVFGGLTGKTATSKVEGYDPAIDTWKSGPDLPQPVHHPMAVNYNGGLVVMGGWLAQGDNLTAVTVKNAWVLRNGAWSELPPLNRPRAAGAAAVVGGRIVVVGGQADGHLVPETEIFDGNRWIDAPAIPTPRDHLAATSDDHFLYAIGGRNLSADKNLGAFERFDPATGKWFKGPGLGTPRGGLGAAIVGGKVVAVGGETPTEALGTVEIFDFDAAAWAPGPPLRTPRHGLAVQSIGPQLYAVDGGRTPGNAQPLKVAEVLRM
ncbi:MAG: protein kinase, partial [Acidimicrobiales bacterium]|nr:protein kinase [Acidimicrobiales bacterium]